MTTHYRPIDSKREEFRKYLERAGVMDALTKALVSLYEETDKPADALDYVRKHLGDSRPDEAEYQKVKNDLEQALTQITTLEEEITRLNTLLSTQQQEQPATEPAEAGEPAEAEQPEELGITESAVIQEEVSAMDVPAEEPAA